MDVTSYSKLGLITRVTHPHWLHWSLPIQGVGEHIQGVAYTKGDRAYTMSERASSGGEKGGGMVTGLLGCVDT